MGGGEFQNNHLAFFIKKLETTSSRVETLVINKAEMEEDRCMMGKERPTNRVSSKSSILLGMYEQDSGFYKPEGLAYIQMIAQPCIEVLLLFWNLPT